MKFQNDPNRLEVYSEIRKSKMFVGTLSYDTDTQIFSFKYDMKYLRSKSAIPISPELPLKKPFYTSEKGKLFSYFYDRIPSKENPAYEEYCLSQGISPSETNLITLLTTIGRRGPSTFIFEPIHIIPDITSSIRDFRDFRKNANLTLREVSAAFDLHLPTLSKIETGKTKDKNTLKLLSIYLKFPDVALWQIHVNEAKLHKNTYKKLISYFKRNRS